jgi:DNA-directed RNA polymerase specialized sigma24 family protein
VTFQEYVHARGGALFRFASVLTGDRGLAEDVVQDVLIRAHRMWPKIAGLEHQDHPYNADSTWSRFVALTCLRC